MSLSRQIRYQGFESDLQYLHVSETAKICILGARFPSLYFTTVYAFHPPQSYLICQPKRHVHIFLHEYRITRKYEALSFLTRVYFITQCNFTSISQAAMARLELSGGFMEHCTVGKSSEKGME